MEVTGSVPTEHSGILSREALAFVADLARGFDPSAHRAVGALVQRHDVPRRQPEDLLEGERVGLIDATTHAIVSPLGLSVRGDPHINKGDGAIPDSHAASHGGHTRSHGVERVDEGRAGNARHRARNDAMDAPR